jgi:prepilin-type N-terminal cleavage/methylation domain-containing protein
MILFLSSVKPSKRQQQGFSLIEMAIVLVILGMLLGGLMIPLSSQREVSQRQATERQLQEIRNALIGFAQINNRLPCPAQINTNGVEARVLAGVNMGNCTFPNGVIPFMDIGIQGSIINQNLVDVWQQPILYRLTSVAGPNPPATAWVYAKSPIPLAPAVANRPDFQICNTSVSATLLACANAISTTATNVVAVVIATGENHGYADELENTDVDRVFVMHSATQNFDDVLIWISQPTLTYELSRAGQ